MVFYPQFGTTLFHPRIHCRRWRESVNKHRHTDDLVAAAAQNKSGTGGVNAAGHCQYDLHI